MTSPAVVTTMSKDYYNVCGKFFIESFCKFWPKNIDLFVYTESEDLVLTEPNVHVMLLDEVHGWRKFQQDAEPFEAQKDPTDYKYQARRFSHKVFAIADIVRMYRDTNILFFDADVEFTKQVDDTVLEQIVPQSPTTYTYLGREKYHTEGGFYGFNRHAAGLVDFWVYLYESLGVFKLVEWHDCMAFDQTINFIAAKGYNLAEGIDSKHPWPETVLGTFSTHYKGPGRKNDRFGNSVSDAVFKGES